MNRLNVHHTSKVSRSAVGLLALVAMACSLRPLDDLQRGEAPEVGGAGGTAAGKGGATNAGGTSTTGTDTAASNGGSTTSSSTNESRNGGASNSLGGTAYGGATGAAGGASSGGAAISGGATNTDSSTTGGPNTGGAGTGGIPNLGGTNAVSTQGGSPGYGGTLALGGVANLGGASTSTGGATAVISGAGGTTSNGGATSTRASSTGGESSVVATGGAGTGGAGTGGGPVMTYNIPKQSCSGGLTCLTGVSCCNQIEVPSGSFQMGTNTDALRNADESPPHVATVDAFAMDEFEVTVGRFRSFYQAYDGTLPSVGDGANPKRSGSGWQLEYNANMPSSKAALQTAINCNVGQYQTWTEVAGVRETMPMNCVSWYVAFAFCIWDGGRLPSEAEWEKAASSGVNEWRFPWGATDPDPSTSAVMNCLGDGVSGCSPNDIIPVGSRPQGANTWGHLDLAGSMWEWTFDYYDTTYYQAIGTCDNCINTAGTTPRAIRGGNFLSTATALRATGRASKLPIAFDPYNGFRCIRTP